MAHVTLTDDNGLEFTLKAPQANAASAIRPECIQELITTFLSTRSIPLAILAFVRCSFGFSEQEATQARALIGE